MLTRGNGRRFFPVLVFLTTFVAFLPSAALAVWQDITGSVAFNRTRPIYDYSAQTDYFNGSLANLSAEAFNAPIRLVIESLTTPLVTVQNADGVTDDGTPFYDFSAQMGDGRLEPGETSAAKRFEFSNPNRLRFNFTWRIVVLGGTEPPVNAPPVLAPIADQVANESQTLTVQAVATDPDGDSLAYSAANLPAGASFDPDTHTFSWTPSFEQSGTYVVTLTVTDSGGLSDSAEVHINVVNVNRAPWITSTPGTEAVAGLPYSYDVDALDADGQDVLTFSLAVAPAGMAIDAASGQITWTPSVTGSYDVGVKVEDGAGGADTQSFAVLVTLPNAPPVADAGPDQTHTLQAGQTQIQITLDGTGSRDDDGTVVGYHWTGALDPDDTAQPAIAVTAGIHVFTLVVTDDDGTQSAPDTVTVTVEERHPPEISVTPTSYAVNEGQRLEITVSATDADGDSVTLSATPLMANGTFSADPAVDPTGTFAFVPDFTQQGSYAITFTATDTTGLADSQTIDITVNNVNRSPAFTSLPVTSAVEGVAWSYQAAAEDPDADPVVFSLSEAPEGMTIDSVDGLIVWASPEAGAYPVTVEATDGQGGTDSQSFIVSVAGEVFAVWFVDGQAAPGGDGLSWQTAFNRIQSALSAASAGEEVWVKAGMYLITETVAVDKAVHLYGGFAGDESTLGQRDWEANVTTLSGEYFQGLGFMVTADATFDGFTVTRFYVPYTDSDELGAAMRIDHAAPTLSHCRFTHNRAGWGGAVFNIGASPAIRDCAFIANTGFSAGGGIYNRDGSSPLISRCRFEGNESGHGGGVFDNLSASQISQCTFIGNLQGDGSAIAMIERSTPTITDSVFIGNVGNYGAVSIGRDYTGQVGGDNSVPDITHCSFMGNKIAIGMVKSQLADSPVYIEDCNFTGNYPTGIDVLVSFLAINRSEFFGNNGSDGGAILNINGDVTITNSRFHRNWAGYGGAIYNEQAARAYISNSLFNANSARSSGGAIYNIRSSSTTVVFSDFIENRLDNGWYGSAIYGANSSPSVARNCIFWDNVFRTITGDVYSNADVTYSVTPPENVGASNHNVNADPLFRDAARGDFRVLPGSPAIDAGTTEVPTPPGLPLRDMDGNDRLVDGDADGTVEPDMGAHEYTPGQYGDAPEPPPSNLPPVAKADARVDDVYMIKDHYAQRDFLVGDTVELEGSGSSDPDGDALTYRWSLAHVPQGSGATLSDPQAAAPTLQLDIGGVYVVQLVVSDGQAESRPDFVTLFTENQPPSVADAGPDQTVNAGEAVQLDCTQSQDPDGDYLTCLWEVTRYGYSGVYDRFAGSRPVFVPEMPGVYTIQLVVRDISLQHGASDSVTVFAQVSGDRPPLITSTPLTEVTLGQTYRYRVTATGVDAGDQPLYFSLDAAPEGMTIDPGTGDIVWGPRASQIGPNSVRVQVADQHGSYSFQEFTVNVADDPPRIVSTPLTSVSEGQLYSYRVRAVNFQLIDVLTFYLDAAPAGMTIDAATGLIQWTPGYNQAGTHDVTVRVVETAELFDTQQFTITVINVSLPPVITSTPETNAVVGQSYIYDVEASDPDSVVSFSLPAAPLGMTVDPVTGLITWTPTQVQLGTHNVFVRVDDPDGLSASQSFQVAVTGLNEPPVITSMPVTAATEFHPYTYALGATDPDFGDILRFSLEPGCPAGMTIHPRTGLIQWTPVAWESGATSMIGNHDVTVRVEDAGGLFDTQSFVITVQGAQAGVKIEASPETLTIPLGSSASIMYTVTLQASFTGSYSVSYLESIAPAGGGLSVQLPPPSGWNATGSAVWLTSQVVTGDAVGTYEITASATVNETGMTHQATTIVHVTSAGENPFLYSLGAEPGAIEIATPTDVTFTTRVSGSELAPTEIVVEEVDDSDNAIGILGALADDGSAGDLVAGDHVYSGTFSVVSAVEGKRRFRASATFDGIVDPLYSSTYALAATRFPTDIEASDDTKIVLDPATGSELIGNEVVVSFVDGTEPDQIEAIIHSVGGEVIGTLLGLEYYQVAIPYTGAAAGVHNVIDTLLTDPRVRTAEPDYVWSLKAVVPSDPYFATQQWGLSQIRADEAWVTARAGEIMIAVIDSGVDYDHPDLDTKIITGKNFTVPRNQPLARLDVKDDWGHGTHVAGIVAAETDNAEGVAGVAWGQSKILAVKVCDANGHGEHIAAASGIDYAAAKGARILNLSIGGTERSSDVYDAIRRARERGAMIIAGAGNENTDEPFYPAAFLDVLGVGATDRDGESDIPWINADRGFATNYGDMVYLAAPGAEIFSTMPTYHVGLNDAPNNLPQNYAAYEGTSMAAPMVSGAAAVLWSRYPSWMELSLFERLAYTAKPIDGDPLGAGRIDLFDAVFNGGFEHVVTWTPSKDPEKMWRGVPQHFDAEEIPNFNLTEFDRTYYRPSYLSEFPRDKETEWYFLGFESNTMCIGLPPDWVNNALFGQGGGMPSSFGVLLPPKGSRMAYITTGRPGENMDSIYGPERDFYRPFFYLTFMEKRFRIQPGQTQLPITVTYDFISEDVAYGRWNDGFQISLEIDSPDQLVHADHIFMLANAYGYDLSDAGQMTPLPPDTPEARLDADDYPLYHTDWQTVKRLIPLPPDVFIAGGMATLRFTVYDTGAIHGMNGSCFNVAGDSALFIDDIQFR